jgi:S-adenosylmethionine hydrolase
VITFLSDYGLADGYVGVCHAVIARRCPAARIIDLTHAVPRHDVRAGALALRDALPYTPAGVHLAVVDPGVGSARRALALAAGGGDDGDDGDRTLVGPDNGLLIGAADDLGGIRAAFELTPSAEWLDPLSATFHGRDIFAPIAAAIADGVPLAQLGVPVDAALLCRLETRPPQWDGDLLTTSVLAIDSFGNVSVDAGRPDLERLGARAAVNGAAFARAATAFADGREGELLMLLDSAGRVALVINGDSAAEQLALAAGACVRLAAA